MAGRSILDTPGFQEAAAREQLVRDAAFLGLSETVAGYELRAITLRDYLILGLAKSPLLSGETPTPAELAQFLWLLSVDYCASPRVRRRFLKTCRRFTPPAAPRFFETRRWRRRFNRALFEMARVLTAAREYLKEAAMDCSGGKSRGFVPSYYSDACFFWGSLGRSGYAMSREELLAMPLKILFQCARESAQSKGAKINNAASAGCVGKHLERLNEELGITGKTEPRPLNLEPRALNGEEAN